MKRNSYGLRAAGLLSAAVMTGCMAAGCGESSKVPETPEEFHAAMVDRSIVRVGNTARLDRVMEKAESGENITIAYVGGSITEGYAAGSQSPLCYASLSAAEFQTAYCKGGTVTCQNNGLSGTPSILGNLRAESEVFPTNPDIIFIEFAVNDGGEYEYQVAYESLVRTALEQEQQPAVILLFTYMETGHTCQDNQQKIGEHYDLGMISVRDAIVPEIEAGRMQWSEYGDDDVHPSADGHALLAEFIKRYFEMAVDAKDSKSYEIPAETVHPVLYQNATLIDATTLQYRPGAWNPGSTNAHFRAGFTYQPNTGNEPLAFEVTGKRLFIVYKLVNSKTQGMMGVYVNGKLEEIINGYGVNGWGGPAVQLIYEGETVEELHVELKMLDDHVQNQFEVMSIGVCTE